MAPQPGNLTYPNVQLLTNTYFGNTGDERLQEVLHQIGGGRTISRFDYANDAEGEIQNWQQQAAATVNAYGFQYDAA